MSLVEPDVYSYKDPDPIVPYGVAISTFGLTQTDVYNGYGAVSRGLLWQLYDIWLDYELYDSVTTSWANSDSVITTTWADSDSVISTSWANDNAAISTTWNDDNPSVSTSWANEGEFNGF